MTLLIKLAWRNVLKNRRRAVLAGLALGISLASVMFINGIHIGMTESMIRTATDTLMGQGQIHAEGFRETLEVENTINRAEAVLRELGAEPSIEAFTPRTISFAMLSSAGGVKSVLLYGIDPDTERAISMVDEAIKDGAYLTPGDGGRVLIGVKTAETLEVGLGDRMVLTVAQAATGELSQEMLRVGGIFQMGVREADEGLAFIGIETARRLLGLEGRAHEIAFAFMDINMAGDPALPLWGRYSGGGNEAIGWKEIVPQLGSMVEMTEFSTAIMLSLIFPIVAIIVINTLFMSLYERMFEFGVLRAIGTRPGRMAAIIFLEAAFLSLISMAIGAALGYAVIKYFSVYGIDYRGIEFGGITITELLYPALAVKQFVFFPLVILAFSLMAAIYPAVFAARLTPAEAMRKSL